MSRQLDAKGSEFLKSAMIKSGVHFVSGKSIEEILGNEKVTSIHMNDGTAIEAQILIVSTGIRQNVELAKAMGIETNKSIVVNNKMETSMQDIYACGDCAEFEGANYAIWPQAIDMGKVAGANAAGDEKTYLQTTPAVTFSGMKTSIFSIGDIGKTEGKHYKTKEYCDEENLVYKKSYFLNGKFCGGILIGDTKSQKELFAAYEEKLSIDKM